MKRFFAVLTTSLGIWLSLSACRLMAAPAPTVITAETAVPVITSAPAENQTEPTALASPTETVEPAPSPTEMTFSGTAVSFEQLSLVIPSDVAAGGSGMIVPEAKGETVAPWDVAPEHIQLKLEGYALGDKFHQPQFYVYPAEAYVQMQERGSAKQSLEQLRAILSQSSMVNVKELPFVPFFNVPQALAAQVKVIPFQNGRGVRMVTEYAMGRAILNNYELIYHFEGLTDDGQYYVIALLPITAPGLPDDGQPGSLVPPGGVPVPDYNNPDANWMGYYGEARQMLQNLEASAYSPDLDQLDALIGSLTISTSD